MPLTHHELMSFWLADHWVLRILKVVTLLRLRKAWEKRRQWRLAEDRVVAYGKQLAEEAAKGRLQGLRYAEVRRMSSKEKRQYYLSCAPQYMREQLYRPVQGAAVHGDPRVMAEATAARQEERRQLWQQKAIEGGDWVEAALAATYAPGGMNYGKWGSMAKGKWWWPFTWGENLRWFMPEKEPQWVFGARVGPTVTRAAWEVDGYDASARRQSGFRVSDPPGAEAWGGDDRSECQKEDQQLLLRTPGFSSAHIVRRKLACSSGAADQGRAMGGQACFSAAHPCLSPATAAAAAAAKARAMRFFKQNGHTAELELQNPDWRNVAVGTRVGRKPSSEEGRVPARASRAVHYQEGLVGGGVHWDADDERQGSEGGATKVHVMVGSVPGKVSMTTTAAKHDHHSSNSSGRGRSMAVGEAGA
jgi:hypothetical protein